MKTFRQKLEAKWAKGKFVCVGLDPDPQQFPVHLKELSIEEQLFAFFKEIIDATGKIAAAFKPNTAWFEDFDEAVGIRVYELLCHYIRCFYPHVVLICDAKRGDIGKTNAGSVRWLFDRCRADAVTVQNYFGQKAVQPFLDRTDKGVFVLCRTSNEGAGEFQDKEVSVSSKELSEILKHAASAHNLSYHIPLYQYVAARVNTFWNGNNNCGLVTGATYPEEIGKVREVAPKLPLLIPGIGTQGGDLEKSVKYAVADGELTAKGFLVSSSSGVLYASSGLDFAKAARVKTMQLDNEIRAVLARISSKK